MLKLFVGILLLAILVVIIIVISLSYGNSTTTTRTIYGDEMIIEEVYRAPGSPRETLVSTPDRWHSMIPLSEMETAPVKYLEIGTASGTHLFTMAKSSYVRDEQSELHYIDSPEYTNCEIEHANFLQEFEKQDEVTKKKIYIHHGLLRNEIPRLANGHFDIIYIDGKHDSGYVSQNAVLCFRKLKSRGYMVFDKYELTETSWETDGFLSGYHDKIECLGNKDGQLFLRKL